MRMHSGVTPGGMPTLVVAASNSLHPERADYRCDGVGDQVEINDAITALATLGGRIQFMEGDFYLENVSCLNGIDLQGTGDSTIFHLNDCRHSDVTVQANAAQKNVTVTNGALFRVGDYVAIKSQLLLESCKIASIAGNVLTMRTNLTLTHPVAAVVYTINPTIIVNAVDPAYIRVHDIHFEGNEANQMVGLTAGLFSATITTVAFDLEADFEMCGAVFLYNSSHIIIEDCHFNNMPGHGVLGAGAYYSTVRNNVFKDINDKGVVFVNTGDYADLNVSGNEFYDIGYGPFMALAPATWGDAIQFHTTCGRHIIVNDNQIEKFNRQAIHLMSGTEIVCDGNVIYSEDAPVGQSAAPITVSTNNVTISNCHVSGTVQRIACIQVTGATAHDIEISNCTFKYMGTEAQMSFNDNCYGINVVNVYMEGTRIAGIANGENLYAADSTKITLTNCTLHQVGLSAYHAQFLRALDILLNDCDIYDNTAPSNCNYNFRCQDNTCTVSVINSRIQLGFYGLFADATTAAAMHVKTPVGMLRSYAGAVSNTGISVPRLAQPFLCVLAYGTNNILAASANGTYSATTQVDLCRNLVAKLTKGTGTGNGQIQVTGVDQFGNAVVEAYTFTGGATATQVLSKIFATIDTNGIVISGLAGNDTIELGVGNKLGLVSKIITGAVVKCSNGTGFIPVASYAPDTTYHGVDFTVHGAIAAGDVYTIFYLDCLA